MLGEKRFFNSLLLFEKFQNSNFLKIFAKNYPCVMKLTKSQFYLNDSPKREYCLAFC